MAEGTIEINLTLAWKNPIGLFFGDSAWGAITFTRRLAMPLVPVPFMLFPQGPEWMNDVIGEQWRVFENKDGSLEIWLECQDIDMGHGTKEDVEETIQEMLSTGWNRQQ